MADPAASPAPAGGQAPPPDIANELSRMGYLDNLLKPAQAAETKFDTDQSQRLTQLDQMRRERVPPPRFSPLPQAPQQGMNDVMKVFGQPAIWLAMFGSFRTKTPMLAALKAATGAMNGYAQGQRDKFDQDQRLWHDQLDVALRQNQMEMEGYRAAVEQHKGDMDALIADITAQAAMHKDQVTLDMARMGKVDMILRHLDQKEATQAQLSIAAMNAQTSRLARQDAALAREEAIKDREQAQKDLESYRADQLAHEKVMEGQGAARIAQGEAHLNAYTGKLTDKTTTAISDLESLRDRIKEVQSAAQADPGLVGAVGSFRRTGSGILEQFDPTLADPAAADFALKVENLQATMTKDYLGAHYFTKNSAGEMEKLLESEDIWHGPSFFQASTSNLISILQDRIDMLKSTVKDVRGAEQDPDNQRLLNSLGYGP